MNSKRDSLEYDVLGFKVKMKSGDEAQVSPDEIVELVRAEANRLLDRSPHLSRSEAAILVALKLGYEKVALEREYRDNIEKLHSTAGEALQFIEEVSPTTI